jgi:hypothetical protein
MNTVCSPNMTAISFLCKQDVDGSVFVEMDGRKVKFELKTLK